ncbi:putative transmembrane protein [Candidatus Rhodobacter oscarellae]|uniref:Putative transmembrane protein n=1 Tax=Candidatus Rhodobacter oscarellae TaxID=1675527 RepID=A0A0J9DZQ4_9RHOB|nr:DUF2160 family membrane protein [Candidatus Rhodobacter lobularis]KMW56141.1 putative transmembrane protein [Candidatus Rhodobacter lobularis]
MSEPEDTKLVAAQLEDDIPDLPRPKSGFLPIETNWFDRLFISVVIWIALSLFWFRFVEPAGLSIWISNAISAALAFFIIKKG